MDFIELYSIKKYSESKVDFSEYFRKFHDLQERTDCVQGPWEAGMCVHWGVAVGMDTDGVVSQ